MAIAITYEIEAATSRQAGEIMVSLFFAFFGVVMVVCNCIYHDVSYGKYQALKLDS